jgi:hypothetical protein
MMTQRMPDPTDEIKSAMPCPTRWVDIATIAKMKVARKKMNPNPKIQKVRNPRTRHIQPALTADDLPGSG